MYLILFLVTTNLKDVIIKNDSMYNMLNNKKSCTVFSEDLFTFE